MVDEGVKGYSRVKKSLSKRSQNSDGREASGTFPETPSVRSSAYSESIEDGEKLGKISSMSQNFGEKIRSSLPNIAHHLRRLMKFKNQRGSKNDVSTTEIEKPDIAIAMSSLSNENRVEIGESPEGEDFDESLPNSSHIQDFPSSPSNFIERPNVQPIPSTSTSLSEPQTSEFSIESDLTISGIFGQSIATPNNRMISNGVETSMDGFSDRLTLENIATDEGAIIAGDPLDFAATLNAQLGYATIRTYAELQARREREPRTIPLLFYQDEPRDSYTGSSTAGVNGSSTSGSENSSVNGVSEIMEDNTEDETLPSGRRRSDERDETQQFYDAALRAAQCVSGSTDGVVVSSEAVGMDCMPLRPGPFHYLINEQAKSLVALQELQNEVGALLEFRDLVIETFPNLRHKMATSTSASAVVSVMSSSQTSSHIPMPLTSPSSRRMSEWEPGKVRRRVAAPPGREGESSGSSLPRSRSNSHSGGSKNSATVQDSGFSTETSSKDSASTAIPRPTSPRPILDEAEDELWNLLDVIHRKGIRLREEVESLQGRLENVTTDELGISCDVLEAVKNVTRTKQTDEENLENICDDEIEKRKCLIVDKTKNHQESQNSDGPQLSVLRREKEQLLDKVSELEAETISSRARAQELQTELAALSALRNGLEDRLRSVLETRNEIITPGAQRKQIELGQTGSGSLSSPPKNSGAVNLRWSKGAFANVTSGSKAHKNRFRTRTIEKNVLANGAVLQPVELDVDPEVAAHERRIRLGALDSVLISPTRVAHVGNVDGGKIAAILREHSPLELQRHLITSTVHNQCLQKRLDEVEKSTETLSERLDKAREENDDLKFQLEERNIELEGTKARVRVLERLQQRPPTEADPDNESESEPRCEPNYLEPGSSTESARDHHHHSNEVKPSPRRRPSRIPLPGSVTKSAAPKPPGIIVNKNDSRESLKSLKSLTTRPPRDSSRESNAGTTKSSLSRTTARDSSRESLNKQSITRTTATTGKEASRESLNRSLPRNNNNTNNRDSLNKTTTATITTTTTTSSLSRARDSLESSTNNPSNNNNITYYPPGTPPRRPPAPARRSQSLARPSVDNNADNGKDFMTDPPTSWCSSSGSYRHSESSLYPDSLNQESTSATGSTRVEFIIGSPTRHFRPNSAWPSRYFDSINSTEMAAESLLTDEFPLRRGEALAECDSLECHPISSEG